jgi:tetratricopeptide (TPR) repeat protein
VSYTEGQLWELLDQARNMTPGPGQVALIERVIAHADAQQLTDLSFVARMDATPSYVNVGEPTKALVTFAWCISEFDRNPTRYESLYLDLLWHFKYAVGTLTSSPEVPLDRTYEVLDDMQRRWTETGHSLHAVYSQRHRIARHIGDFDTAAQYYELWCAAPRDDLSDCGGCDPEMKAYWLKLIGRDEEAIAVGSNVLSGEWTCSRQPQDMLATLMVPYVRTGRLDQARDAHRRAYLAHRSRVADMAEVAHHIEFCARTGNEARALEMVERHLAWLDRSPSAWDTMMFAASAALALRRAQARRPDDEITLLRPATDGQPAQPVSATALATQLEAQATEVSARFDRRNGTDHVGQQVRAILDGEPWIDYLPLSPTARRTTLVSTPDAPAATPAERAEPAGPPESSEPSGSTGPSGSSGAAGSITGAGSGGKTADVFAKTLGPQATGSGGLGGPGSGAAPITYEQAVELAQTERAAEAVDVLVEAVADRTARGDEAAAADARHALAIAYHNSGRYLDAATVAEEELVYRLRTPTPPGEPSPALSTRRLLTATYRQLGMPDEAIEQLDASAEEFRRIGDQAGVGRMNEEMAEILGELDRDEEAAARYLAAAEAYARHGWPFDELRARRRHAFSLAYAHGLERGLAAMADAAAALDRLPADDEPVRWERAKHNYDEAMMLRSAGELGRAVDLTAEAIRIWHAIGEMRGVCEARGLRARALLDDGCLAEAESEIRQALADLPDPQRRPAFIEVLDEALRAQGRDAEADACWAAYGLTRPE